jgi:Zn-dependent protease
MEAFTLVQKMAAIVLPLIFAVTLHEAAHGWVADKLGDSTARRLGRITLNPIRHIDWFGTILLPMLMMAFTGFLFGWAKPVPVNMAHLRNPRRDMVWVALAGPGANLLMAILWSLALLATEMPAMPEWMTMPLAAMAVAGVFINLILMALNLLPILPLDGGRVLAGILPQAIARLYARIEPFGFFIIVGLLVAGVLGQVLTPVIFGGINLLPGTELVFGILPVLLP